MIMGLQLLSLTAPSPKSMIFWQGPAKNTQVIGAHSLKEFFADAETTAQSDAHGQSGRCRR